MRPHEPTTEDLRELLRVALTKLPLLAFAATLDLWRWRVFRGEVRGHESGKREGGKGQGVGIRGKGSG